MGDERRGGDATMAEDAGPGAAYAHYITMEALLDKLKLLEYDDGFCAKYKLKPFSRHYFAAPLKGGEQFLNFSSLAAWLAQQCGKQFEMPQEYDDPNATITSILDVLREFKYTVSFPPNTLKQGGGPNCVSVLNDLAVEALKRKAVSFSRPVYPEEEADQAEIVEEDAAELTYKRDDADDLDDDDFEVDYEDDGVLLMDLNNPTGDGTEAQELQKMEAVLESKTDATEWRLEVERVLPELKLQIRPDAKDWRVHLEQMRTQEVALKESGKNVTVELTKLQAEVTKAVEKIGSREKYLSSQLDANVAQHREATNRLSREREKYRAASSGITERERQLKEISDELDHLKREMEERGSSMTDAKPVKRIRDALAQLKLETQQMDVRTGVVEHCLIQAKLASKQHYGKDEQPVFTV